MGKENQSKASWIYTIWVWNWRGAMDLHGGHLNEGTAIFQLEGGSGLACTFEPISRQAMVLCAILFIFVFQESENCCCPISYIFAIQVLMRCKVWHNAHRSISWITQTTTVWFILSQVGKGFWSILLKYGCNFIRCFDNMLFKFL